MAKLTDRQRDFDITKHLPKDMPSGEAVDRQVRDPFTGDIHAPGLAVREDGSVEFLDRRTEES